MTTSWPLLVSTREHHEDPSREFTPLRASLRYCWSLCGERRARSAEAAQGKLNVIAEALAALMASRAIEDHNLEEAVTRLPTRSASKSATEPNKLDPGGS
jgi:hypothetical protein